MIYCGVISYNVILMALNCSSMNSKIWKRAKPYKIWCIYVRLARSLYQLSGSLIRFYDGAASRGWQNEWIDLTLKVLSLFLSILDLAVVSRSRQFATLRKRSRSTTHHMFCYMPTKYNTFIHLIYFNHIYIWVYTIST